MKTFAGLFCRCIAKLVILLPRRAQFWLGDFLGLLWFDVLRVRRRIVTDNIKIAFPEMSYPERVRLGRRAMRNMCRALSDFCYFHVISDKRYTSLFEVNGMHYLEEAKKKNRGVCVLSMHLGNGDMGIAGLALHGQPVVLISKVFKIQWLNDMWFGMRSKIGVKFIPPRNSSFTILKALKRKETVIFVNDQFMGPPVGTSSWFFGKKTGSAMGLASMAQRSGAPIIPMSAHRREDGVCVIDIEPEIPFESIGSKDEDIRHMTQKFDYWIEDRIRKYPDQWMWVHRRWKEYRE